MTSEGGGLTRRQFADLLDRLGPRLEIWPAAARAAAERLVATDAKARAELATATAIDGSLKALMAAAPEPLPLRRAAARLAIRPASWPRLAGVGMAALAASLAIGFVLGTALPSSTDDDGTDTVYLAVNDSDLGGVL